MSVSNFIHAVLDINSKLFPKEEQLKDGVETQRSISVV